MGARDAFYIIRATSTEPGQWSLEGRAYEEIHVGDILVLPDPQGHGAEVEASYEVVEITTYRRRVLTLNKLVTGSIVVRSYAQAHPQPEKILVTVA